MSTLTFLLPKPQLITLQNTSTFKSPKPQPTKKIFRPKDSRVAFHNCYFMGNYISCTLGSPIMSKSTTPKLIFPTGEIKQIQEPTKVAEIMMDTPNFFIVNTKTLKLGRRFCPLNADEDLEKGNVYAVLPMRRKNSIATAKDLGALFMAANTAFKRVSQRKGRVQPEVVVEEDAAEVTVMRRLSLEGVEEASTVEYLQRLSISRSKKPLLETIEEETVAC